MNSVIFVSKTGIRMFNSPKATSKIDPEQHRQLEYAQRRIRQKKRLFSHFVIFLIGCVFLFLMNKILKYGVAYDWYLWAIGIWLFLICVHFFNVFVTQKFMGPDWERSQREILVKKQREKIAELQKEIETEFPSSNINKKKAE